MEDSRVRAAYLSESLCQVLAGQPEIEALAALLSVFEGLYASHPHLRDMMRFGLVALTERLVQAEREPWTAPCRN